MSFDLFGCEVFDCSDERAGLGVANLVECLGNTEIAQLHPTVGTNEDVCRLHVSVNYAVLMSVAEACSKLQANLYSVSRGKRWTFVEDCSQVATFDKFHDDRVVIVCGSDRVVDGDDRWVGQARGGLSFAAKSREHGWIGREMTVEHLDCNASPQVVIEALPNLGHATSTDAFAQLIAVVEATVGHPMIVGACSCHENMTLVLPGPSPLSAGVIALAIIRPATASADRSPVTVRPWSGT